MKDNNLRIRGGFFLKAFDSYRNIEALEIEKSKNQKIREGEVFFVPVIRRV